MKTKAFPTSLVLRRSPAHGRGGFTLAELLVVCAVIGILAAITFPVYNAVRRKGHQTACMSNLKQLGLAFQQYANDNGRRYPFAGDFTTWGNGGHWVAGVNGPNTELADLGTGAYIPGRTANVESGAIYSYVRSPDVYICPANGDGKKKRLSYSMNCAMSGAHDVRIRKPSELVLLVDEDKANDGYFFAVDDGPAGSYLGAPPGPGTPTNSTDALTLLHNDGGNLLFCDGHVKFYSSQKLRIDGTPEGKTNKWRTAGVPRFHDRALGPWGSNKWETSGKDFCNATAGPGPG